MSTEAAREGGIGGLRRVGLGVAGLGRIGLRHAENLAGQVPSAELLRVVDADEARARATGEQLGVAWSTSYEDLLADQTSTASSSRRRHRSTSRWSSARRPPASTSSAR